MSRVVLVSHSDMEGGAARATWRLNNALLESQYPASMLVAKKITDAVSVVGATSKLDKVVNLVRAQLSSAIVSAVAGRASSELRSINILPGGLSKALHLSAADVVNLHWVNFETLSIASIGKIRKPLVWTLHDMWPFCGAEHYVYEGSDARYVNGYAAQDPRATSARFDLDRWTWRRKQRAWTKPTQVVTPSQWLASCVKESALMRDWPVTVIPNALDVGVYKPWPKALARDMFALPQDVPLIMFGADGGARDKRKGWDLLQPALALVAEQVPGVQCVVFGQGRPSKEPEVGLPLHWPGVMHDDVSLALLYSAVDAVIVPSRLDNLPQCGTEAQACGCPVVAFDVGGLPDVVSHLETGYLATPFSSESLAEGIAWVLNDAERYQALSGAARRRAEALWGYDVVAAQYIELYERLANAG